MAMTINDLATALKMSVADVKIEFQLEGKGSDLIPVEVEESFLKKQAEYAEKRLSGIPETPVSPKKRGRPKKDSAIAQQTASVMEENTVFGGETTDGLANALIRGKAEQFIAYADISTAVAIAAFTGRSAENEQKFAEFYLKGLNESVRDIAQIDPTEILRELGINPSEDTLGKLQSSQPRLLNAIAVGENLRFYAGEENQ